MSQTANSVIFPNHTSVFKRLRAKSPKASTTHNPAPHIHSSKSPPSVFP